MVEGILNAFIEMFYSHVYRLPVRASKTAICRMTVRRGAGGRSASMASCSMPRV